jgi:hypothetical protein
LSMRGFGDLLHAIMLGCVFIQHHSCQLLFLWVAPFLTFLLKYLFQNFPVGFTTAEIHLEPYLVW